MKVVASATRGKRKTALGMDVTGAYSTLWHSKEGERALKAASQNESTKYFPILAKLTGGRREPNKMDGVHPKLRVAVQTAIQRWETDEKTLIFCFRIPTATVLRRLISEEIEKRIASARRALTHGRAAGDEAMSQFKKSLTARAGSVLSAFMDRVLLSWAESKDWPRLELSVEDFRLIANIAARARVNGKPAVRDVRKPDRVLMARICEHVLAAKYLNLLNNLDDPSHSLLVQIANETWVKYRYGRRKAVSVDEDDSTNETDILTRSSLSAVYELADQPDETVFRSLQRTFSRSTERKAASVIDSITAGPNFFLPLPPFELRNQQAEERARHISNCLWNITLESGEFDWDERGQVVDAVNRVLLRDHFLLRLPRSVFTGEEESWSESLVRGFHSAKLFQKQGEPVAAKIADFLEDLKGMTQDERTHGLRYALNPQAKAVVLVSGSTKERDPVFRGFNSPLLPEILVCTQVGQEGIDLHRHCRHVVHYDLDWNPALIEQRTGRVDRLGSKTQREQKLFKEENPKTTEKVPGLEIGMPYLAATYDERMFDRLYSRAQAFELLTGGDPSVEANEQFGIEFENADRVGGHSQFVALPEEMRKALRVDLSATPGRNR
jgi:hypothetical protein